jgi:hypothetical protein
MFDFVCTVSIEKAKLAIVVIKPAAPSASLAFAAERRAERELTAQSYALAARLEQIAARSGEAISVDVSNARVGVVRIELPSDISDDGGIELAIEACADCGIGPGEAL